MSKKKKTKNTEIRADTTPAVNDDILRILLGLDVGLERVTRADALEIPTIQACISLISSTISRLPLQLLRKKSNGDIENMEDDPRVKLLNEDTGDTLSGKQFWRAMLEDYYLGKGGFAYLNRSWNQIDSIHYVKDDDISIGFETFDPIFKDYDILVMGSRYRPSDFLKILRKTRDGMKSTSILEENQLILSVALTELKFELANAKRGGAKRGFLQSEKPLTDEAKENLKENFRRMYGKNEDTVVVLNEGMKFAETSASAAELQINENKTANSEEICKLFGIPASMVCGSIVGNSMTDHDMAQFIRTCVGVMADIECSLNRDLLLESEKGTYFWQFDTKELTRGSIKERYEAYKIGLDKNFLQIDEVREKEGMEPLGIDWLQLNLNTVFYDPKTKEVYTPNNDASMNLATGQGAKTKNEGGEKVESGTES